MRIVGGRWKGRALAGPKGDGGAARLRPTSDRMREALFNVLEHGDWPLRDARVLDLFAGTGALGFEALSRGAARVQFVDDGPEARALLRRNAEALDAIGQVKIYRRDATRLGECRGEPYDLAFLDPPYGKGLGERALAAALAGGWLAERAAVVWETGAGEEATPPEGLERVDRRRFGAAQVDLLRRR